MLRTSIQVVESCEVSIKIASQKMRLKSIACLSNTYLPLVPISSPVILFELPKSLFVLVLCGPPVRVGVHYFHNLSTVPKKSCIKPQPKH